MRRAAKVDDNQTAIVAAFRAAGAAVKPVHTVKGFVDLVVGYCGQTELVEIKNLEGKGRKLTEKEQEFWDTWKGRRPVIVESPDDVESVLLNML